MAPCALVKVEPTRTNHFAFSLGTLLLHPLLTKERVFIFLFMAWLPFTPPASLSSPHHSYSSPGAPILSPSHPPCFCFHLADVYISLDCKRPEGRDPDTHVPGTGAESDPQ